MNAHLMLILLFPFFVPEIASAEDDINPIMRKMMNNSGNVDVGVEVDDGENEISSNNNNSSSLSRVIQDIFDAAQLPLHLENSSLTNYVEKENYSRMLKDENSSFQSLVPTDNLNLGSTGTGTSGTGVFEIIPPNQALIRKCCGESEVLNKWHQCRTRENVRTTFEANLMDLLPIDQKYNIEFDTIQCPRRIIQEYRPIEILANGSIEVEVNDHQELFDDYCLDLTEITDNFAEEGLSVIACHQIGSKIILQGVHKISFKQYFCGHFL